MDIEAKLQELLERAAKEVKSAKIGDKVRELEVRLLGRKGELTEILRGVKGIALEQRPKVGAIANQVKQQIEALVAKAKAEIAEQELAGTLQEDSVDATIPGRRYRLGHLHPLTQVRQQAEGIFRSLGFRVADGPELESEHYNFDALNILPTHPARDVWDTFYIDEPLANPSNRLLLRTHTSPVQIRALRELGAPLRLIAPGRCFRSEATDARHEHTFDQLEGLMVDQGISLANLKAVLLQFARQMFGLDTQMRTRPKFYPFVEPGMNVEVTCFLCQGNGCRVCKKTGWLEIAGAGLVHPNVLRRGGVDPEVYSGFAFGFGLTRLAMLRYGITDIRLLLAGDVRFLEQF